jgi:Lon-like protease
MMTHTEPSNESVSVDPDQRRRSSAWAKVVMVVAGILGISLVAGSIITVPYYSQSPGSATPLEDLIVVDGVPVYPSDGEVFFTTVRLAGELSALEYVAARFDDAVVVRHRDQVLGNQTRDEQRQQNLDLMSQSQELAKRVALEYLGYDVVVEIGGLITLVEEGSPSEAAVFPGDVITSAGGVAITTSADLVAQIQQRRPGDVLELVLDRFEANSDEATEVLTEVVLGTGPDDSARMGVGVSTAFDLTELPIDIEIDTNRVGGPSAGLALSLSLLDLLTDGELTGGVDVATTGTIDVLGNVGPIGGVEQKVHAVRRAGIDLFLVPTEDYAAALTAAGDDPDFEIVPVATFDEAVQVLADRGGNGLEWHNSIEAA